MVRPVTLTCMRIYDRLAYGPFTLTGAIMRMIAGWVSGHPLEVFSTVDQGKWWTRSLVPTSARLYYRVWACPRFETWVIQDPWHSGLKLSSSPHHHISC